MASYLLFRPGIFISDTYSQYHQAVTCQFNDWHPPIMAFIWSLLLPVAGAGSMLLFHLALYWGAFALIADTCIRNHGRSLPSLVALSLLPTSLFYLPFIWKDVGLAAAVLFILGTALVTMKSRPSRGLWGLTLISAFYAVNVRHLSFLTIFPILGVTFARHLGLRQATLRAWLANLGIGLVIGTGLAGLGMAFNKLILRSGPNQAVHFQLHDIVATLVHADAIQEFPVELMSGSASPEDIRSAFHSDPLNADVFSPWGKGARLVGIDICSKIFPVWLRTVTRHPLAYLSHRLEFAWRLLIEIEWWEYEWSSSVRDLSAARDSIQNELESTFYHDRAAAHNAAQEALRGTTFRPNGASLLMRIYVYTLKWIYAPIVVLGLAIFLFFRCIARHDFGLPLAISTSVILFIILLCFTAPLTTEIRYLHWCYLTIGLAIWLLHARRRLSLSV